MTNKNFKLQVLCLVLGICAFNSNAVYSMEVEDIDTMSANSIQELLKQQVDVENDPNKAMNFVIKAVDVIQGIHAQQDDFSDEIQVYDQRIQLLEEQIQKITDKKMKIQNNINKINKLERKNLLNNYRYSLDNLHYNLIKSREKILEIMRVERDKCENGYLWYTTSKDLYNAWWTLSHIYVENDEHEYFHHGDVEDRIYLISEDVVSYTLDKIQHATHYAHNDLDINMQYTYDQLNHILKDELEAIQIYHAATQTYGGINELISSKFHFTDKLKEYNSQIQELQSKLQDFMKSRASVIKINTDKNSSNELSQLKKMVFNISEQIKAQYESNPQNINEQLFNDMRNSLAKLQ